MTTRCRDTKLAAYRVMAASSTLNYMGMRSVQVTVVVAGAVFLLLGGWPPGAMSPSCCW